MESKFNLLDEPWVLVRKPDETVETVSLTEALLNAQTYLDLAGETRTQDAAVLRLLVAIVHKVILENDLDGVPSLLEDPDECYDRWDEVWSSGHLPAASIQKYLEANRDNFWLIDEKNPFMQSLKAKHGTHYGASKLFGDLSESANKLRLFPARALSGKQSMSFGEAARWVPTLLAYDDTSGKSKSKSSDKEAPGVGWLGKIGQIYAKGRNLFETLMLNCVLVQSNGEVYPPDHLSWEENQERWEERHKVPQPEDFGSLMTLRSRLILLESNKNEITGYGLLGGEFFDQEDCFAEPFTVWWPLKKGKLNVFLPKHHSATRQLWRDFSSIFVLSPENETVRPGIVEWIDRLIKAKALPSGYLVRFEAPYVTYGKQNSAITSISSQNLTVCTGIFDVMGSAWVKEIQSQITKIDKIATCAGYFYADIAEARGGKKETRDEEKARGTSEVYAMLDQPFTSWVSSIDPVHDNQEKTMKAKADEWIHEAAVLLTRFRQKKIERSMNLADPGSVFGRVIKEQESGKDRNISILEADQRFAGQIRKYFPDMKLFGRKKEGVDANDEQE